MKNLIFIFVFLFSAQSFACQKTGEGAKQDDQNAVSDKIKADKRWTGYTLESIGGNEVELSKGNEWVTIPFKAWGPGDCSVVVEFGDPRTSLISTSSIGTALEQIDQLPKDANTIQTQYVAALKKLGDKMSLCHKRGANKSWVQAARKTFPAKDLVFMGPDFRKGIKALWAEKYEECTKSEVKEALYAEYLFLPTSDKQSHPTPLETLLNSSERSKAIAQGKEVPAPVMDFLRKQPAFKKDFSLKSTFAGLKELF